MGLLTEDIGYIVSHLAYDNAKKKKQDQLFKVRTLWLLANLFLWDKNLEASLSIFESASFSFGFQCGSFFSFFV